ncbi:MAG: ABC transporter permease subunit [Candidatus Aminicenantes bacterium]|nr:ABC transporter permease subunit [Candidatus Aminicenantes bacterium]
MLKDIIKKEILETITSAKFVFTFLLCAILILLSVFTGISNYRSDQKEYSAALALNKKNLESQTSYATLAQLGTKINKAPQVLGAIASGVDEAVGRVATVNIAYDPNLVDSKYESNPIFSVFGALDLTFIVKIVLSLFAILFTYDAIVGEKERGTLKLTLSNRVPRDRLILGKFIGGFVSLLIPLIIPLVLGMLILLVSPNISMSGEDWTRLLLMFLMFFLYLSVFFSLGLFVSARTNRSSTSFLILLFLWVIFVTVIPKLSVTAAAQLNRIPSVHEITAKKDAFLQQVQGSAQKQVLDWVNQNRPKPGEDPKAFQGKIKKFLEDFQQESTKKIDENNAALERDYQLRKRSQEGLAINLSRISPASALMFSTMSLARTGIDEHERFLASIRAYKPIFTQWANARMMRNLDFTGTGQNVKVVLDDMPLHKFEAEALSKSFVRTLPDFAVMIVLIIAFFVGAYISFLKADVR